MKEFVFPTIGDLNDGCGVLIGDLFVTAAHVVMKHNFLLSINGEKICLKKVKICLNSSIIHLFWVPILGKI